MIYVLCVCLCGAFASPIFSKNLNYRIGATGHMLTRIKEADTIHPVDILVLGSSHAYRSYDPRAFKKYNINLFNLGSSAQTPIQTEFLLKRYLDRLKPQVVIFDIYPLVFEIDGVESTLDLIANTPNDNEIFSLAANQKNIKIYNTLIYDLFRETTGLNDDISEPLEKNGDKYIQGGFVETTTQYKQRRVIFIPRKYSMSIPQVKSFDRILRFLQEKETAYIFVQSPMIKDFYLSFSNNKQMDSIFSTYGSYHNYNEIMDLDNSHFMNEDHMNQAGVEKFSNALMPIVLQFLKENVGRE